jgi:RNA polymerase sigma-70 factor (ECF subfamily)
MTIDSENYILKQIQNGDAHAFEALFKTYYKQVYNHARYYIKDESACHDVVQEIFLYIWDKRKGLAIEKSIKSYLFMATHNACVNFLQKQATKQRAISNVWPDLPSEQDGYDVIFENALRESIEETMEELPEQCKEVFKLSRLKGYKHKEIAQRLNISTRTVETQIYRALKVLKKKFKRP